MHEIDKYEEEPLLARESLFRRKLNQLRHTGEIQRTTIQSHTSQFRAIEQSNYLSNASSCLEHTDPRQMESLALLDTLTEVYNHDTLCRILKDELRRAQRYQHPLTLLAIAIDGLPKMTIQSDATAFDALLKSVAQLLMQAVRDVDIPGRYDLERFIILCPETNLDGALSLAGRLCSSVESKEFFVPGQRSCATTSIGIATFPDLAENYDQLINLSLQSLTIAQHAGGNIFKIGSR